MAHEFYMERCLQLAKLGAGHVAPNPMVGAVLVHDDRIIGEGWHQHYGEAHAEVNCIASVKEEDKHLLSQSVMYVSLEPCSHFGKTPPCADLIIKHKIPNVVVGCRDIYKKVDGRGIEKLQVAGVKVTVGVLEEECKELNKRFFTFHTEHRPYIILKWAETRDGVIAAPAPPIPKPRDSPMGMTLEHIENGKIVKDRLLISNEYTNRLVHRWRSEEAAILVGTNTALDDDPALTTRLWVGPSPVRVVIDMNLRLPLSLQLFDRKVRTIVFNTVKHAEEENLLYYQVTNHVSLVHQLVNALYQLQIQSILVEGGAILIQSFIDEKLWDEVRLIKNNELRIQNGLPAPKLSHSSKSGEQVILSDTIEIFKPGK
ncbi:MAG: bifunctional diaminohydroxyphosphoribosylaminopyrimidine deaminase/5-amino-6-(5-phosphoribosylamino)uracil reductase RibD [Chitinophagaceae bacterium]